MGVGAGAHTRQTLAGHAELGGGVTHQRRRDDTRLCPAILRRWRCHMATIRKIVNEADAQACLAAVRCS